MKLMIQFFNNLNEKLLKTKMEIMQFDDFFKNNNEQLKQRKKDFFESYRYLKFIKRYDDIHKKNSLKYLYKLKSELIELQNIYLRDVCGMYVDYIPIKPFDEYLKIIDSQMKVSSFSNFYLELKLSCEEEINGYKLFDTCDPIMDEVLFNKLKKYWYDKKIYSSEEFLEIYKENICSEWAKMDKNGDSFQGYWKYPKESYEYKNAFSLTIEENGKYLWELPYPKSFVLKTLDLGCSNRMESVRYSNFLCEWYKRKIEQMKIHYELAPTSELLLGSRI